MPCGARLEGMHARTRDGGGDCESNGVAGCRSSASKRKVVDMSDDLSKTKIDALFVNCSQDHEEQYTASRIAKENDVSMERARVAFRHCCKAVKGNQPRAEFMACAEKYLKG